MISLRQSLRSRIEAALQLTAAQKSAIIRRLDRLPDGETLCHFDFHPDQVMLTSKGPIIIDWLTAHRGHPAADVARSSIILSIAQAPNWNRLQAALLGMAQGLYHKLYLQRYLALNPAVRRPQIRAWMLPVAAARLNEGIKNEERGLLAFVESALDKPEHAA